MYKGVEPLEMIRLHPKSAVASSEDMKALFNIISMHSDVGGGDVGVQPLQFPEIGAAFTLLEDAVAMLPSLGVPTASPKRSDVFDWLQAVFGFQEDSVKNQREHLVMLLAAMDARMADSEEDAVMSRLTHSIRPKTVEALLHKLTGNYKHWCNFHQLETSIADLPSDTSETVRVSIVYIALWLLIWGEAANVRFLPECLCYIYHHMAIDPRLRLHGEASTTGDQNIAITNFLKQVIVPIYDVIAKEAQNSSLGDHAKWRNYDDLNEYFWSKKCHKLGWPMNDESDFFGIVTPLPAGRQARATWRHKLRERCRGPQQLPGGSVLGAGEGERVKVARKENWVEVRTVLQIIRSFERVWIFYILLFQALVITAWHSPPWTRIFTERKLRYEILSLSITYAACRATTACIDLLLSWRLWRYGDLSKMLAGVVTFFYHAIFFALLWITFNTL